MSCQKELSCEGFTICNRRENKLFKVINSGSNSRSLEVVCLVQVSDNIRRYHDSAAYPGINTTIKSIKHEYFWPGMSKDFRNYVQSCRNCQLTGALPPQPQRKLQPIPPPDQPWNHIGIDLVCDLQENTEGYKHILVTTCYLSKFCPVRPLKTKTSREVLTQLENIYFTLGVPQIIQHDQRREFVSKEFQDFHHKLKVHNRKTTAYHPQSNGLVEVHNKIIKTKLHKMLVETSAECPSKLQAAVLAANTCWKKSTDYSPFYLMYGREANFSLLLDHSNMFHFEEEEEELNNLQLQTSSDEKDDDTFSPELEYSDGWIESLMEARSKSKLHAQENIHKEQQIQKYQFDDKVKKNCTSIKQGDQILVRNMQKAKKMPGTKKGGKYIGPMTIAKVTESYALVFKEEAKSPKRECTDIPTDVVTKKFKKSEKEVTMLPGNWKFGISKESLLNELENFKLAYTDHKNRGVYLSKFHETLQKSRNVKDFCIPLVIAYQVLKDCSPETMRREITYSLMEFSKHIYPDMGPTQAWDYVDKVLYALGVEWEIMSRGSAPVLNVMATVSLDVCLNSFQEVKSIMPRSGVSDGKDVNNWYFNEVLATTPSHHINSTSMSSNGSWATDAELIAASALLEADIYVANKIYRTEGSLDTEIRWSRLRASNNYTNNPTLYIANYSDHYEPVYCMFNSKNPTFSFSDKTLIGITDS
ncbi:hypothetical protein LOD99_3154 [Oopsacas minuta]|uniref:Integrase catalytic domain-containing protein n=1 Tax=Oopsacas minuta TaxID=111878 RepID=A0AAV7JZ88_9METZ|nr:hypothetical protein LOD99_3154 [Oopsacas minuta]